MMRIWRDYILWMILRDSQSDLKKSQPPKKFKTRLRIRISGWN